MTAADDTNLSASMAELGGRSSTSAFDAMPGTGEAAYASAKGCVRCLPVLPPTAKAAGPDPRLGVERQLPNGFAAEPWAGRKNEFTLPEVDQGEAKRVLPPQLLLGTAPTTGCSPVQLVGKPFKANCGGVADYAQAVKVFDNVSGAETIAASHTLALAAAFKTYGKLPQDQIKVLLSADINQALFKLKVLECWYFYIWQDVTRTPNVIFRLLLALFGIPVAKGLGPEKLEANFAREFIWKAVSAGKLGLTWPSDGGIEAQRTAVATALKEQGYDPKSLPNVSNFWIVQLAKYLGTLLPDGTLGGDAKLVSASDVTLYSMAGISPAFADTGKDLDADAVWCANCSYLSLPGVQGPLLSLLNGLTVAANIVKPTPGLAPLWQAWFVPKTWYRLLPAAMAYANHFADFARSPAVLLCFWTGKVGFSFDTNTLPFIVAATYDSVLEILLSGSTPGTAGTKTVLEELKKLATELDGLPATPSIGKPSSGQHFCIASHSTYLALRRSVALGLLLGAPMPLDLVDKTLTNWSPYEWQLTKGTTPANTWFDANGENGKCDWAALAISLTEPKPPSFMTASP